MSWLSAAWTRNKGAIASVVSGIPVVGGLAANAVQSIRTGDYVAPNMDPSIIAEQERINRVAAGNAAQLRETAANAVAGAGYNLTTRAAAAIGPPGNPYQRLLQLAGGNPLVAAGMVVAVLLLLYMTFRKGAR